MSIIVDGYNYIGRSQEFRLEDSTARDKIIYLMGQYCAKAKKSLTLIFDGNYFVHHVNRKRRYGRVTVIYTSPIYTADDAIKKMIRNQPPRRRKSMLVVSSDTEILEYAQAHGTPISKSENFEQLLYRSLEAPKQIDRVHIQISDEEVQEWLKLFGPEPSETQKSPHTAHLAKQTATSGENPSHEVHSSDNKQKKGKKKVEPPKGSQRKSSSSHDEPDIDRVHIHLSSREVQEWMNIFGEDSEEDE